MMPKHDVNLQTGYEYEQEFQKLFDRVAMQKMMNILKTK